MLALWVCWHIGQDCSVPRIAHHEDFMTWTQRTLELTARSRGFHLITEDVLAALPEVWRAAGWAAASVLQHTSASLSINENADPDVPLDLGKLDVGDRSRGLSASAYLRRSGRPCRAHVKSSLLGCSLSVPIREGRPCLGTWQGIYLCEHRNHGGRRRVGGNGLGRVTIFSRGTFVFGSRYSKVQKSGSFVAGGSLLVLLLVLRCNTATAKVGEFPRAGGRFCCVGL